MNILQKIINKLHYLYVADELQVDAKESIRNGRNQFEDKYLSYDTFPEITDEELRQFQETWPMWNIEKCDLTWARVYKKFWDFSPYVIGNWHTLLLRKRFNPYEQLSSFENKALCDIYFPEIPYPKAYVRRISGVYYDIDMNVISKDEAITLLTNMGTYVIKPAFGTMQGEGVRVMSKEKMVGNIESIVRESIDSQKSDFIAQEIIEQHPDIAKLNPTSLNCCRVTSLFIGGKYSSSAMMKIGKLGSKVDNWHSSYLCGVSSEGKLFDRAFDNKLKTVSSTDNGIVLEGIQLPLFTEMCQLIEGLHKKYFPNCGTIGWDVVIDNNNKVRIIEANLTTPGIVAEQLVSGDFIKSLYHEIINNLEED